MQKPLFAQPQAADSLGLEHGAWRSVPLALAAAVPHREFAVASAVGHSAVIYLGLVPSLIAYGTWAVALSRLPASRASNFMYCVPPVATLLGFVWLGKYQPCSARSAAPWPWSASRGQLAAIEGISVLEQVEESRSHAEALLPRVRLISTIVHDGT